MSYLQYSPQFSIPDAVRLARERFGLETRANPLPSERDQNFLLRSASGERFVLKIANGSEERTMLEAQQQALAHLAGHTALCQRVVPAVDGQQLVEVVSPSGSAHWAWLVNYLPGTPLAAIRRHSPELLQDLGRALGEVDRALASFDHPAIHRAFHWDLAQGAATVRQYLGLVADPELRCLTERLTADFERDVAPGLGRLRRSAIYNDANHYNVLVGGSGDLYHRNQQVVGLVDWGDMVYSYTAGDLAVAIAYAVLQKPDPLAAAAQVVHGYQAQYPLTDEEVSAAWGLACLRLCMSVCLAAHQQPQRPDDDYLVISQLAIRETLPRLVEIPPALAETAFRHACGWSPSPAGDRLTAWLRSRAGTFAPLLDADLGGALVLNLSVGSPLVDGDSGQSAGAALARRIADASHDAEAKVAVGRYDEARLFGTVPDLESAGTIHLGIDLFVPPGSRAYSPLAGTVHSWSDSDPTGQQAAAIILEHRAGGGQRFYTRYGCLSRGSLQGLWVGKPVARGERLGVVGAAEESGRFVAPCLHFQIIADPLGLGTRFPEMVRASERVVWCACSPDPNLLLGIPPERFPPAAPTRSEILARRQARIGRTVRLAYRKPVHIARGWMQYLFDEEGRRYLDAYNNVPHVGHCQPRVVRAGQEQMAVLNTNTRYLHYLRAQYAERLCATLPEPLRVCFFVNSGSEGNELALRLARAHTGQRNMIVLEAAYHGNTGALIDISPYKHDGPGGSGAPDWVHTAPLADDYRGPYRRGDSDRGARYADHVAGLIERLGRQATGLAGFIAESCPSVGGQILFPPGYLAAVYDHVHRAGGVCIADEVQTGYGRMGTHFWGFQAQGVVPDIVVLGKPIGNGHPIGAVITTPQIAASFDNGMEFFSTFGGNTVSCAIGLAVLEVVLEGGLQAHAFRVGERMLAGLRPLMDRYPLLGDVRGTGLFLGVELVRSRETLEPAGEEASFIVDRMRDEGIFIGTDGPHHNVLKIRPPMPFSASDADHLVATLERILAEDFSG